MTGSIALNCLAALSLAIPGAVSAQARLLGDLEVERGPRWHQGGAQIMQRPRANARSPIASQFDSAGVGPLGAVGDTVTIYQFPDGANLTRLRYSRITRRERFFPPRSWRLACDDIAHPGWLYWMDAPVTSWFGVVVAGKREMPEVKPPPASAMGGAEASYRAWADSAWQRWQASLAPSTERESATMWYLFHSDSLDAGWHEQRRFGLAGPGGRTMMVFSSWLHDDYPDNTPNTTATWLVDGWGNTIARSPGHVDIYGVTDLDGDGVDEVITSRGVIRWDGSGWRFPMVYSEEPCLMHQVMEPPPGRRN